MAVVAESKRNFWIGIVLLLVVLGLGGWVCQLSVSNYASLEESNLLIQSLLENQSSLTRQYAQEVVSFKNRLEQTEIALEKIQQENAALQEKLALLDQVNALEDTITELKEKNAHLIDVMSEGKANVTINKADIRTVKEAKALIKTYSSKVKLIKGHMKDLQREVFLAKKASQHEEDLRQAELGNNGFIVRDGKITTIAEAKPNSKNVNIDVTFVK